MSINISDHLIVQNIVKTAQWQTKKVNNEAVGRLLLSLDQAAWKCNSENQVHDPNYLNSKMAQ